MACVGEQFYQHLRVPLLGTDNPAALYRDISTTFEDPLAKSVRRRLCVHTSRKRSSSPCQSLILLPSQKNRRRLAWGSGCGTLPPPANGQLAVDHADLILDYRSTPPRSHGLTSVSCHYRRKSTRRARLTSCTPCQTSECASCPYSDRYPLWYASLPQSSECSRLTHWSSVECRRQFGNVAAAYVLTQLAGFKMEPLPVKCVGMLLTARARDFTVELHV